MNIREIESLTEVEAKEMALETMQIKEHNIYFVDLGEYFKYSVLVFKNGKHIHYANDYELHHAGRERKWLRNWYINTLNHKLYTESEICGEIKDYDEYTAKERYLRNYYPMQIDYVSAFRICSTEAEEKQFDEDTKGLHLNPISFCYMSDIGFIKHQAELFAKLQEQKEKMKENLAYWKDAFKREMYNHEYAINWTPDADTLSAFGNINYRENATLTQYFDELGFNDTQRTAYALARREYYKEIQESDIF